MNVGIRLDLEFELTTTRNPASLKLIKQRNRANSSSFNMINSVAAKKNGFKNVNILQLSTLPFLPFLDSQTKLCGQLPNSDPGLGARASASCS